MKKSAAFTLIELLVVIAIIAILAGIALPVYQKVLERGHATQDASNMRQIGIGTIAYLNDNNDTIFSAQTNQTDSGGTQLYAPALLKIQYVPNPKVFHSPFDTRQDAAGNAAPIMSYGVNTNILNPVIPATGPTDFDGNWTKLTSASQLVYLAPNIDIGVANQVTFQKSDGSKPTVLTVPTQATARSDYRGTHMNRGQINVLYADGHVLSTNYRDYSRSSGTDDDKRRWAPIVPPQ